MSTPRRVAEILRDRVVLEVESLDRLYLNLYVPTLQRELGAVMFFRAHWGEPVASSALMGRITQGFVQSIERFVKAQQVPVVSFAKSERKEAVAARYLAGFPEGEGVLFVGRAQEKATVFRTQKRRDEAGARYPWIVRATAMVNHYYFYCVDREFGPFFLKFCSYFPYNAKLCLNGHEYLKRQLQKEGIAYEALDNGILSCADAQRLQALADALSAEKIEALVRKWLARLPHPYTARDQAAGYTYEISILQAEFSLTQVLDRPQSGRILFEELIRENLDLGRPSQVQLIFARRVTKKTPGRFRTRVITEGVTPSLHIDYKSSRIKQYHKEGRALRTETTINNPRDFSLGKRLGNLPALRQVGFSANRRLLHVQKLSQDCCIGEALWQEMTGPIQVGEQRVSALRFEDPQVQALLAALVLFRLLPRGFSHREIKEQWALLLGIDPSQITAGRMTYALRRLRLRGLIERIAGTHRYRVSEKGLRLALFFTRTYLRIVRTGLAQILDAKAPHTPLRRAFVQVDQCVHRLFAEAKLAA